MQVTVDVRDHGVAVLQLDGRLDLLSAAEVKQQIGEAVAEGHQRLVVDLGGITFLDSSGLGALVGGLKAARLAGGDLRIARPGSQARTILGLTTLDRVLHPHPSVEDALAGFA